MDLSLPQLSWQYLAFAAGFVLVYWLLSERFRNLAVSAASVALLALLDHSSLTVAVIASLATWVALRSRRQVRSLVVILGVVALIVAVKGRSALHLGDNLAVPIGFGFYSLKLLHYTVESRRGSFAAHSLWDFLRFMLFFPTLLVGPIHRFEEFQRSERRRRWDPALFASGLEELLYGYAKLIILANCATAFVLRRWLDAYTEIGTAPYVLGDSLLYGLYLYFAFAGYSSLAVGWARLLGYEVGPNFRFPFLQANIGAFWRSWHISLSDWCRRYVFLPVLASWRVPMLASILSMLAIGVWHEFTPRYVAWGLYHGLGIVVWRLTHIRPWLPASDAAWARIGSRILATSLTFVFVMLGFVITKNATVAGAVSDFAILLTEWDHG